MNLWLRLQCAWDGFLGAPAVRFYVVEEIVPLGWCILFDCATYDRAAQRARRFADQPVRIMVSTEWERRTLETMRRRNTWLALMDVTTRLDRTRSEVRDLQTIRKSNLLEAFMERKHP